MANPSILVESLCKRYRIGHKKEQRRSLLDGIASAVQAPVRNLRRLWRLTRFDAAEGSDQQDAIWALRDVSFEVSRGDVVGIIGRNGSGKSTLLKVLSRITPPTSGRATVSGRVASLLEVGTGFHPELTGRENVFLNGIILGMKKREVERKFDAIVDFSGVERFIDTPVKRFSSGMRVRLAFSVAAHLEPEVLLVDEVLAVGDFEFRNKCLGKMDSMRSGGRTVLFVSHNLAAVRSLCRRAILLDEGAVISAGDTDSVIRAYVAAGVESPSVFVGKVRDDSDMSLLGVTVRDSSGEIRSELGYEEDITIEIEYQVARPLKNVLVAIGVRTAEDTRVFTSADYDTQPELLGDRPPGTYRARVSIPACWLNANRYKVVVTLSRVSPPTVYEEGERVSFTVTDTGTPGTKYGTANRTAILQPLLPWDIERVDDTGVT